MTEKFSSSRGKEMGASTFEVEGESVDGEGLEGA